MKIAFDLDNTLIRYDFDFPLDDVQHRFLSKILSYEPLRKGTKQLFDDLQAQNHETWIYTSSFRNPFYIRKIFWLHGIKLHGVINQDTHNANVSKNCSKYPPQFGIDTLIDDSEGVKIEGERNGFDVIWLQPNDADWVKTVKQHIFKIKK